jgi:hypothetical protein
MNVTAGVGLQQNLGNPTGWGVTIAGGVGDGLSVGGGFTITENGVGGTILVGFGFGEGGNVTFGPTGSKDE